ncbi:MAG TPA: DUF2867 domain-containing protein, partial [Burkholderiaceae bacterium]|nr:DUF2867 domain-containing protein [Burkholderiaceae bacterium]
PSESQVAHMYPQTDLADAYAIRLPNDAITDPELLARFIFSQQGSWVAGLMTIRDATMARFGVKTSKQLEGKLESSGARRVRFFRIYETHEYEIVLGEDDKHLDFRLSVMLQKRTVSGGSAPYLVLSTVVHCHNRLGRVYIALIAPFHRLIAQSSLRRAAKTGWPLAAPI